MVLQVDNVDRRFGANVACSAVSLSVDAGEIVALLGENGAGKSTLLSIIAGFVVPERGTVAVDGVPLPAGDPAAALRAGIGTAFQHVSLAPELTVRESLELARIDVSQAAPHLRPTRSLDVRVADLSVPERQQVEFLKARMLARRVLLLDEPTSPLGEADVEPLLRDIRTVAASGTACVFVTHRLQEAMAVADRIVVMRRGHMVDQLVREDGDWPSGTREALLAAMFGDAFVTDHGAEDQAPPAARETVGDTIVISGNVGTAPLDISLEAGRVLAIAGIAGNGQGDIVDLLSGATATRIVVEHGTRTLEDAALHRWVERNVALVPEDRFREGGAVSMPLGETLVARDLAGGRLSRWGLVSRRRIRARAGEMIRGWEIQPADPTVPFGSLSGGNAQRVLLARALDPLPRLLVAAGPTNGLDHTSVEMVRRYLRAAADAGTAVVTIEYELDEALRHADLVSIVHGRRLSPPEAAARADRQRLQAMMVGGWSA